MQARHLFRDIFQIYLFFSASKRDHIEVVKEFLNHNADIEAKDNDGNTALILDKFLRSRELLIVYFKNLLLMIINF